MKRSKHSLSNFQLLSCKLGGLYPIGWFEALPGDTIQQSTSAFIRCAPLVAPPMHPVHVRIHHFFVPNRLIWQGSGNSVSSPDTNSGFESFITGGHDGNDATAHPFVQFSAAVAANSLDDYLGIPSGNWPGGTINVSALPRRAYQFIWNEYYRDQQLEAQATVSTADGLDTTTQSGLQQVSWGKDYLTTARSTETLGPNIAAFPSNAFPPVVGIGIVDGTTAAATPAGYRDSANNTGSVSGVQTTTAGIYVKTQTTGATGAGNLPAVQVNLGQYSAATSLNALRRQFALMRFAEARNRFGARYVEYLRYLGVRSSDARLQRPEYLGGGTSTLQFSEVLQTGPTTSGTGNTGVGIMAGHGVSAQRTNRYRRFFEEHGIVMSLLSVRPVTVYTQPIQRKWLRGMTNASGGTTLQGMLGTREDYWQRELQHLGSQVVNQCEVDVKAGLGGAFGYQDRYDEYRRMESEVHGQFRTTLTAWHFARAFASAPSLNGTFIACVPPATPFQDTVNDQLYVMVNHSIQARRMVAKSGSSYVR